MKKIFLLSWVMIGLGFGNAYAMKIAFVDVQQAVQAVKAGQRAKKDVEKEVEKRKKDLERMRGEIVKLEENFKKQELVLSEESKQKKRAEYQTKAQDLQAALVSNQQEMQQLEQKALSPILEKMSQIIKKISKDQGYDMVLMKGALLYADDTNDLTDELVKAFDKEYK